MRVEKIYIAYDGTHFSNENDCKQYEEQNDYKKLFENYGDKIRFLWKRRTVDKKGRFVRI